jgi:hypothetical protein
MKSLAYRKAIERQECSEQSVGDARKRLVSETGGRAKKWGLVRGSAGALAIMTAAKSLSEAKSAWRGSRIVRTSIDTWTTTASRLPRLTIFICKMAGLISRK